ncbi:hypothetical protein BDV93DRAFT_293480 [Ceratobasidium sp. AG-I]|nr:hypothetical protein BDV93DRAFT_293480 [Ceratobasidium sp. AG-I]
MSGPMVRFIRWDRARAIVSQAFNCANNPDTLWHFLWWLESLDMAQRGFDTTIDVDSARAHESAFAVTVEDQVCFELGIDRQSVDEAKRALDLHHDPERLSILPVSEGGAISNCCVSRSVTTSSSVAGRGTRGYWGLNISTRELCFLKDKLTAQEPVIGIGDMRLAMLKLSDRVLELRLHRGQESGLQY